MNKPIDWRVEHFAHLAACCSSLNFTPVRDVLIELGTRLPNVETDVLRRGLQRSFARLVSTGDVFFWVIDAVEAFDLSADEALKELVNPVCWDAGGRYLASARMPETSYFACIAENIRQYASGELR